MFPISKPIRRFLVAIAVGLIVVASISWWLGYTSGSENSPSQSNAASEHPPRINITRAEYEQALAKWKAQKIEEYEITTDTRAFLGGIQTVHVSDYGNKMAQVFPQITPLRTMTDEDRQHFESDGYID